MNMDLLLLIALLLYLAGAFQAIIIFATKQTATAHALFWKTATGFVLHTASIVISWIQLGHFPIVNVKEVSSFVAWAIVAYYLVISRRFHARALAAFILPVVFLFALIGLIIPEVNGPLPVALEGAIAATTLTRVIFPVHVTLLIFSYAAFTVTFLSGIMYLAQERELK